MILFVFKIVVDLNKVLLNKTSDPDITQITRLYYLLHLCLKYSNVIALVTSYF